MSVVIKFGKKHKGKKVEDCPSDYLQWLVDNLDPEDPNWGKQNKTLVDAATGVLIARAQDLLKAPKSPAQRQAPAEPQVVEAREIPAIKQAPEPISIKADLDIAYQAIQRIAMNLERQAQKNNDQPY